ncbi:uncharacterized protein si:ch211-212k18.13 isoform X1 [Chanodichthys erythropterus]|uniref:uncharacterized protein si:ch211-212k18.13 isoform X1 n=1 Tax=Chanodichthys erythropterus TaxID=933992 RepID=UPI00351F6D4B
MSFIKGFRNEVQYNGLQNQGATCYLNAVLQCLFMTPEFREAVESYKAPGECGEENLLLQLQKLFTQLSEKAATTGGITKSLGIRSVFEQQDAVEYYRKILKAVGTHASKVFEGKMNNITKCGTCGNETIETNTFISILLSIDTGNDKYDMEKSLKTFFEHSKLEEDDWMYCEGCERKTETETWSEIHEYPTVLALHLKRFDFDYIQMRYEKNECRLDVPLSLPEEDNRPRYDLYAVINHKGGYSAGHYDTIIRSYENGIWYRFDDYSVTQYSESSLENSSLPYMLMYRKSLSSGSIKTAALNPGSIPHPMRILLIGPSRAGKSTVGNIILGGNYFLCKSGSKTVTKASMVKTVGKVTVVDTPNLFSLNNSSWVKEMQKLSDPGPNVILWVTPISKFSEQQQGLFHTFKKRLDSRTTKRMMIIFTNDRQLKEIVQPIDRFILDHRKLRKVVCCCQNRYHVIDITDGHNYTSELLEKLSEMVTSKEATAITPMQLKCLRRRRRQKTSKQQKMCEQN